MPEGTEAPKEPKEQKEEEPKERIIDVTVGNETYKRKVKDIPVEIDGEKQIVTIKKLTFGERADYGEKFVNVKIRGEFEQVDVSLKEMQLQALLIGIHEAPFKVTREYLMHGLDGEVGETIHKAIDAYNKLNPQQKKKLEGDSKEEPKIPE